MLRIRVRPSEEGVYKLWVKHPVLPENPAGPRLLRFNPPNICFEGYLKRKDAEAAAALLEAHLNEGIARQVSQRRSVKARRMGAV